MHPTLFMIRFICHYIHKSLSVFLLTFCITFVNPVLGQQSEPELYVSSRGTDSIKRYNAITGAFIDDFVPSGSGGLDRPQQVAFDSDGHLYVTGFENGFVKKYDGTTGEFIEDFSKNYELVNPTKMTFHTDGMI